MMLLKLYSDLVNGSQSNLYSNLLCLFRQQPRVSDRNKPRMLALGFLMELHVTIVFDNIYLLSGTCTDRALVVLKHQPFCPG